MPSEENRSAENLLLLCISHSYEIDEHPDSYPAELLHQWRLAQRQEHDRIRKAWPLDETEAEHVLRDSFDSSTITSQLLAAATRAAEQLALAAESSRHSAANVAAVWKATWDQSRAVALAWDEDGNPLYAEPSQLVTEQHRQALIGKLSSAAEKLEPLLREVKTEAAVAQSSAPRVTPWAEWLTRAADDVFTAATRWPEPPPFDDDTQFPNSIVELRHAARALATALRGDPAPLPTVVESLPEDNESAEENPLERHKALLDRARPYSRVNHRPYDPSLFALLVEASVAAATIPPVVDALAIDLRATTSLAARVARNASSSEFAKLVATNRGRRPLCVAVALIRELTVVMQEEDHRPEVLAARAALKQELDDTEWSRQDAWAGNEHYGPNIFAAWSSLTSAEHVRERLTDAITLEPSRARDVLLCCANWVSLLDRRTGRTSYERTYNELPTWYPHEAVIGAAARTNLATGEEAVEIEDLLQKVVEFAKHAPQPNPFHRP